MKPEPKDTPKVLVSIRLPQEVVEKVDERRRSYFVIPTKQAFYTGLLRKALGMK